MTLALQNRIFTKRESSIVLLLVGVALNACENATEPSIPTVIHLAAATPTDIAGVVGTGVTSVPGVRVTDGNGNPVAAFAVAFRTGDGGVAGNVTALTDNSGVASVGSWTLGPKAGSQTLQAFSNAAARSGNASAGDTAVFTAMAEHGPLAAVKAIDGVDQFALTGAALSMPLRVRALDSFDNPIPGVHVAFSVVTGSGSIDGADVLTGSNGEAASGIWTLGLEPGPQDVRANADTVQIMFRATACSPNACRLLFDRDGNIFTWDAGTGRQLTSDNQNLFARWSPDGNRIAFYRGVDSRIYLMNADGSNVTRLSSDSYDGLGWSPDGSALALANVFGFIEILDLRENAGPPKRVVDGSDPDWSPDGKQILFVGADYSMRVVNLDDGGIVQILPAPSESREDADFESPRWSPDGKRIAFTRCGMSCDIYVMQANGSGMTCLTCKVILEADSFLPSWSPDGTRIAFSRYSRNDNHPESIYSIDATGGAPTIMINSAANAEWLR